MQRFIPFRIKVSAFFSSMNGRVSLPLLAATVVLSFVLGNIADWKSLKFAAASNLKLTAGHVYEISATAVSVNKRRVIRYRFTYRVPDSGTLQGVSYMNGVHRFGTNAVPVEYLPDNPAVSRIRGMRSGIISPVFALFLLPMLGIALFFVYRGLRRGNRILSVLGNSAFTKGRFTGERATNTRVNKRRVMACTFEYEVNGRVYRTTARTHIPELIKDDPEERIVYNADDPERALLFDLLPQRIKSYLTAE